MRRQRSTRIIATLGPSSSTRAVIEKLYRAGADAFRLNMSHGIHADVTKLYRTIREVEKAVGRPIGVIADLQGPKLRIGSFAKGKIDLRAGENFRLDLDPAEGDEKRICLPHPEIFEAIGPGTSLLLDDGKIRLTVTEAGHGFALTRVEVGGPLSNRKGVNVPNVILPLAALTTKDLADLAFVLDLGVDWVALSFVQRPRDVTEARQLVQGRALLMAKIEKPSAVETIDEIIAEADGVMVARGDLGVELHVEDVPGIQKKIIRRARAAGKTVVVATQMLESMIAAPVPTRAEVSDVANAVFDGADAVMLSGESAAGAYPVEAVGVMDRVAIKVESDPLYLMGARQELAVPEPTTADAISAAAHQVSDTIKAAAILTYTSSGSTALRAARERPQVPLLVLTPSLGTARRLAIVWGLHCIVTEDAKSFQDMINKACRGALVSGFAKIDDRIVITAGMPFGSPGKTNVLRIARVSRDHSDQG
jgi:pyruvate kinase